MAEKQINGRIVHKHDTEANWNKAINFIPKNGEVIIYDPDSTYSYARIKVGDGTTKVTSLPFIDNAIKTVQANLSDTVNSVKNNSITGLSVSGQTITYTKGNGTTGTITTQDNNTTYSAGTGLSLSGTTFNHKNSITSATAQGDASKTLAFGDTFTIPTITYDAQGHITGKGTTTMTMPSGGTITGYLKLQNSTTYPRLDFKSTSYDSDQGTIYYAMPSDSYNSKFFFRQHSRSSTDYSVLSNYEDFHLPNVTVNRTTNSAYDILTTKSAVTIAQGGTGATTASGARTALEVPSKTGDGASGTWGIDITGSSNKISYSTQLTTDDAINAFNTGSTFQVSTWNNTSSPGVSNGILINAGWTSSAYGVQIAIDDDPTYYIALRQKDNNGWNAWKRIPMGDGTGASGTWGISITGNAGSVAWENITEKPSFNYLPLSGGTLTGYLTLQNDATYPRLLFKSSSYDNSQGEMFYRILSDEASSNFLFRQYCRSSKDYSLLSTYEDFKLPQTTADRTYSGYYDILTTKSAVTVAQGGTGATTAAGARTNLGAYPQADMVFTTGGSEQTTSIKFDGKTVYRKIYSIGSISANGTKQIDTGLATTIDIIFNLRGVARLSESQYHIPLPYTSNQSGYNYSLQMVEIGSTPKIQITAGTAAITSGFVILEYTKI